MTRRAFVHIGTHKTGTTYLQRWMRTNCQALASVGLIYPTIGLSGFNAAHSKLSFDVRATRAALETKPRWAELKDQLLGCDDDVVISAETFSDKIETASHCHKIVRFFDAIGMKTVFIVFLRDVPAYMNSRYVQDAKNLRTEASFETYLKAHRDARAFNYPLMLNPFEAAAPVKVLPYTRQGQVIERRFLESMGRGPRDFDQMTWNSLPHQNTSPGPKALHIARQIAARLPDDIPTEELHFKRKRFKFLAERFGLNDTGFVGCDSLFAETIRDAFADKTDDIAHRYFDESWTRTVPPETMFDRYSDDPAQTEAPQDVQDEIIRRVLAARPTFLSRTRHRVLSAVRNRLN